ncbi:TPA: hypothetical protein ACH7DL_000350 [Escherichia coli]|nr:hypothetical protein [Escherichia coli]
MPMESPEIQLKALNNALRRLQLHRNRQEHYQRVMYLIGHRNIG